MRKSAASKNLAYEITGIVLIKLVIILVAGFTIFGAHNRIHVDAGHMMEQILGKEP